MRKIKIAQRNLHLSDHLCSLNLTCRYTMKYVRDIYLLSISTNCTKILCFELFLQYEKKRWKRDMLSFLFDKIQEECF